MDRHICFGRNPELASRGVVACGLTVHSHRSRKDILVNSAEERRRR
jgi:hypothetical protein